MQHIDVAIASVLQNVDVNPKAQTIEALVDAIDADVEDLQATRYILLKCATNRLYSQVARENNDVADDVRPRLVPKSRIGNNAHVSLARDIYDLFMYIGGAQNVFPRNNVRAKSQNVDSLVTPATNTSEGIDNEKLKSPTSDKSSPTTSEVSVNNISGSRSPPHLLKNVYVSKDINGLYDYIARVASTCE